MRTPKSQSKLLKSFRFPEQIKYFKVPDLQNLYINNSEQKQTQLIRKRSDSQWANAANIENEIYSTYQVPKISKQAYIWVPFLLLKTMCPNIHKTLYFRTIQKQN